MRSLLPLLFLVHPTQAADLITDEPTRLRALTSAFPKTSIHPTTTKLNDATQFSEHHITTDFPDALKSEPVYSVAGPLTNRTDPAEKCASDAGVAIPDPLRRQLRFQLFRTTRSQFALLAQYHFADASPSIDCSTLARLYLLDSNFALKQVFVFDARRHYTLQSIRALPDDRLIVESDGGPDGTVTTMLHVFDFSRGTLDRVLGITTFEYSEKHQSMIAAKLESLEGNRLCFTYMTYAKNGRWFDPPGISHPCYWPGNTTH